jgi:hypothetical protein
LESIDEVKGFVFAVDVVGFDGTLPEDPGGDDKDGDEEGSVEAAEEVFGGEDVFAQGDGEGVGTRRDIAAVDGGGASYGRGRFSEQKTGGGEGTGFV